MEEAKGVKFDVCPPEFDPATVFAQSYCRHRKDLNEAEAKSFFVEILIPMESLSIPLTRDSISKKLKERKVKSSDILAKTLLEDYETLLQQKYSGYVFPSDEMIKYALLISDPVFKNSKESKLYIRGESDGCNIPFVSHLRLAIALLANIKKFRLIYQGRFGLYCYFPKLSDKNNALLPKVAKAFAKLYEERKEIYESPLVVASAIAQAESYLGKNQFAQAIVCFDRALAADPKNVDLLINRATVKIYLGQPKEASLDCDEAIRLNPKSDEAWSQRASLKLALDDLDGAMVDAQEALKLNPENDLAFGSLQEAKKMRGQYAEIIQGCDEHLKKFPGQFIALTHRANAKLSLKFFADAIRDSDAAIQIYPANFAAWRCRADAKMALGHFADAITDFSEVIKLEPKNTDAWHQRGVALLALGRDEEAVRDLTETIKLNPTSASAWCVRAMAKESLGYDESAIHDLDEALKLGQKDAVEEAVAWCLRGELKLRMGWHKDALYDLNQAVKRNPEDDHAWELLGKVKHLLGSYEEAIQDATQALTLNPKNDIAWWIRADCNLRLSNHAKAMEDLNQVLRLNPKNDIAWNDRGLIKYTLDLYEEAVKDLSEAIKLNPKNEMRWRMRGLAQCDLGRYKEAIQDFNEALKLDSKNVLGWRWRGEAKAKLNHYEEAIQDLSKALELEPGNVDIESQIVELGKELDQIFPAQAQMYYESEQYREAISCCDKVLAVQPDNLKILQIRGESHAKLRHHREAIQDFNKVILLDPIHEAALVYRGVARQSLGQNKEAVDDLTKAIALNASLDYAWMFRGVAQQSLGCLEESFEDLSEAVRLNPQSNFANKKLKEVNGILINTWKNKATQYFKTKEYEETIFYCDKVILENPEDVALLQLRGESKLKLGRYEDAIQDLMEVMRLNPENTYVKECLKEARRNLKDESQTSTSALPPKLSATSQDSPVFSHAIKFSMAIPKDQLVFEKKLGEGSFGEVHKGIWSPTSLYQVPVAIKRLKNAALSVKSLEEFRKEVEIQAKLNSVGVVKLMGITAEQPYCMVMEFMEQGSLRDVLDSQKPEELQWSIRIEMAINMARGLAYLHEHDPIIIHGDLKSLNILVNGKGEAKLADFGLAALKTETRSKEYVEGNAETNKGPKGSLLWIAPELFRMNAKRTPATDVFSFAVVLWELASHLFPYESAQGDSHRIQDWVEKGERESFDERTPNTPKEYSDLTQRCWDGTPANRPTAKSIVVELEALYAITPLAPTLFSAGAQPSSPKVPVKKPANVSTGGYLVKSASPLTKSKTGSPKVPPRKSLVGSGNYLVKSVTSSSTSSPDSSPQVPPKSPYMGNFYK